MTRVFPFLGETELEVLAVVGSLLLIFTHGVTAFCVKEKVVVATKCVQITVIYTCVRRLITWIP